MALRINPRGAKNDYWPVFTEVKGICSLVVGTEYLALASIVKTVEFVKGEKWNILLVTEDTADYYEKIGKKSMQKGYKQVSTVLTGIVIGAGFTVWLYRDA